MPVLLGDGTTRMACVPAADSRLARTHVSRWRSWMSACGKSETHGLEGAEDGMRTKPVAGRMLQHGRHRDTSGIRGIWDKPWTVRRDLRIGGKGVFSGKPPNLVRGKFGARDVNRFPSMTSALVPMWIVTGYAPHFAVRARVAEIAPTAIGSIGARFAIASGR